MFFCITLKKLLVISCARFEEKERLINNKDICAHIRGLSINISGNKLDIAFLTLPL